MDKAKCKNCGKVLFEMELYDGKIVKVCPRCKTKNFFEVKKGEKMV